jgi:hypothetical protein
MKGFDENERLLFKRNHVLEELARNIFPGGVLIESDHEASIEAKIKSTEKALENEENEILYQPAFEYDLNFAISDILVKNNEGWNIYEVKNSTKISDFNLWDAAFQYYVLKNYGLTISDICLVYVNSNYKRRGKLDLKKLFSIDSVLDKVVKKQPQVAQRIELFHKVIAADSEPSIAISEHCTYPVECGFIHHCWKDIPDDSVFSIKNMHLHKKFELYNSGVTSIDEIPPYFNLTQIQRIHIDSYLHDKPRIVKEKIRSFVESLEYPLYFLDFESFQSPVPLLENSKPYQQIPFQYSLHIKQPQGSKLLHLDFISDPAKETRIEFIERLIADLGSVGSILVYNKSYEISILSHIASDFPKYRVEIREIINRIVDLMIPFERKYLYKPEMNGSHSIKYVLPALVPELSYSSLPISDGRTAAVTFEKLWSESDSTVIHDSIKHLRDYCKMDTLAMVRILEALESSL